MARVRGKKLAFLYMLIFVSVFILFAEFFHSETILGQEDDCPICLWERTSLSIAKLNIFSCVLLLILMSLLGETPVDKVSSAYQFRLKGRSPPLQNTI